MERPSRREPCRQSSQRPPTEVLLFQLFLLDSTRNPLDLPLLAYVEKCVVAVEVHISWDPRARRRFYDERPPFRGRIGVRKKKPTCPGPRSNAPEATLRLPELASYLHR